jgi:hypothetical protein
VLIELLTKLYEYTNEANGAQIIVKELQVVWVKIVDRSAGIVVTGRGIEVD